MFNRRPKCQQAADRGQQAAKNNLTADARGLFGASLAGLLSDHYDAYSLCRFDKDLLTGADGDSRRKALLLEYWNGGKVIAHS